MDHSDKNLYYIFYNSYKVYQVCSSKGQLISKELYLLFRYSKIPTKFVANLKWLNQKIKALYSVKKSLITN